MKAIYKQEAEKFVQNFVTHRQAGTLKDPFSVVSNGATLDIQKWILPVREFTQLKEEGIEKIEEFPGAYADGTPCKVVAFTMESGVTYLFEYIRSCPPFCDYAKLLEHVRELNAPEPVATAK